MQNAAGCRDVWMSLTVETSTYEDDEQRPDTVADVSLMSTQHTRVK